MNESHNYFHTEDDVAREDRIQDVLSEGLKGT